MMEEDRVLDESEPCGFTEVRQPYLKCEHDLYLNYRIDKNREEAVEEYVRANGLSLDKLISSSALAVESTFKKKTSELDEDLETDELDNIFECWKGVFFKEKDVRRGIFCVVTDVRFKHPKKIVNYLPITANMKGKNFAISTCPAYLIQSMEEREFLRKFTPQAPDEDYRIFMTAIPDEAPVYKDGERPPAKKPRTRATKKNTRSNADASVREKDLGEEEDGDHVIAESGDDEVGESKKSKRSRGKAKPGQTKPKEEQKDPKKPRTEQDELRDAVEKIKKQVSESEEKLQLVKSAFPDTLFLTPASSFAAMAHVFGPEAMYNAAKDFWRSYEASKRPPRAPRQPVESKFLPGMYRVFFDNAEAHACIQGFESISVDMFRKPSGCFTKPLMRAMKASDMQSRQEFEEFSDEQKLGLYFNPIFYAKVVKPDEVFTVQIGVIRALYNLLAGDRKLKYVIGFNLNPFLTILIAPPVELQLRCVDNTIPDEEIIDIVKSGHVQNILTFSKRMQTSFVEVTSGLPLGQFLLNRDREAFLVSHAAEIQDYENFVDVIEKPELKITVERLEGPVTDKPLPRNFFDPDEIVEMFGDPCVAEPENMRIFEIWAQNRFYISPQLSGTYALPPSKEEKKILELDDESKTPEKLKILKKMLRITQVIETPAQIPKYLRQKYALMTPEEAEKAMAKHMEISIQETLAAKPPSVVEVEVLLVPTGLLCTEALFAEDTLYFDSDDDYDNNFKRGLPFGNFRHCCNEFHKHKNPDGNIFTAPGLEARQWGLKAFQNLCMPTTLLSYLGDPVCKKIQFVMPLLGAAETVVEGNEKTLPAPIFCGHEDEEDAHRVCREMIDDLKHTLLRRCDYNTFVLRYLKKHNKRVVSRMQTRGPRDAETAAEDSDA